MSRNSLGFFFMALSLVFLILFIQPSMLAKIFRNEKVLLKTQEVYVFQVDPGGSAEQAGIRPNDKIVAINGTAVTTLDEAAEILRATNSAKIEIRRNNQNINYDLRVNDRSIWPGSLDATLSRHKSVPATPINIIVYYWQQSTTDNPIPNVIVEFFIFSLISFLVGTFIIWQKR